MSAPEITLYTASAPNGIKISMALEYLELPYTVRTISLATMEQKQPWFLEINPNGRIPAITDKAGGKTINLMESGAIFLYLVEKYDPEYKLSYPIGTKEYYEVLEWLFWQVGGQGPMQGQTLHFLRYAATDNKDTIEYGFSRYYNETRRLYGVLNKRLVEQKAKGSNYLVGDHVTVADLACVSWAMFDTYTTLDMTEFPAVAEWELLLAADPKIKKGMDTPSELKIKEIAADPEAVKALASGPKEWIKKQLEEQSK
ncbi:disulfide-bond oxidoreductase YfcG [Limtongia smithiae]|uniref:disulfide-bond oxidoreductase YfcG n=1 Tax=Limtongia smithiae TaxID=1125753 RepID=UPI0034CE0CD1